MLDKSDPTSCYDPLTKQSRPKRKYLGTEDPETGRLIPSSGKRGRKKRAGGDQRPKSVKPEENFKVEYDKLLQECGDKDARIRQLEHENKKLKFCIQKLRDTASDMLGSMDF